MKKFLLIVLVLAAAVGGWFWWTGTPVKPVVNEVTNEGKKLLNNGAKFVEEKTAPTPTTTAP